MATKNKLSVYLVKEGITSANDIFEDPGKIRVLERYSENSAAYFVPSLAHEPNWLRNFFLRGGDGMLLQANSRVVLIKSIQIDEEYRTFALTFGYARFLFREDVLEEQFGLKIVLNSIKQNQIRRISKASVGSNQKQSDEQLPKSSDISEFGFDVNRDLMKNVSGKSEDDMFEKSMLTGGDIFSLTVARDISNIDEFLVFCYRRFKEDTYRERFAWVDNIKYVKEKTVIQRLNQRLIATIRANEFDRVWMAVPEVVAWEDIKDFKFAGCDETFGDIYIDKVIESIRNELTCVEQLQSKRIYARASRDETENAYEWSVVADGLFCREIDGLFCRSSPDIIVRRRCVLSHKRRGWLQPSPSFRYSRNLALQNELYHPVINNGPAVLVCVDKRLGTGPVNQSRDAG